jgi:hypothetical protein
MPLMKQSPYRIVSAASLKQCIFWLAYDQTPLLHDHEDIRESEVEKAYRSLLMHRADEPKEISRAKNQLILSLTDGRLIAMGYEGHALYDKNGRPISEKEKIASRHWRSSMQPRDWDDSTLYSKKTIPEVTFTQIEIVTTNLFKVFPHDGMEAILKGHKNAGEFTEPKTKRDETRPRPQRLPGDQKPETIEGWKEAYDEINAAMKTFGQNCTLKKAAAHASMALGSKPSAILRKRRHYITHLKRQNGKNQP